MAKLYRVKSLIVFCSLLTWSLDPVAFAQASHVVSAPAGRAPANFADVVAPLLPAVVNISTTKEMKRNPRLEGFIPGVPHGHPFEELLRQFGGNLPSPQIPKKSTSLGSGFVLSQEGKKALIVTCNHVIEGADEIKITLQDDVELIAKVVGKDRRTDLALLEVQTSKKLSTARFGDSSKARVGEWLIAIGNPFGLASTVTIGVISTIARDISARGGLGGVDYVDGYIQTDAPINMGNSGGPMFDEHGNVLAISTAIFSPTGGNIGIGFGIPSNLAKTVIEQFQKYGRTRRGWIGVVIQPVDEQVAESLGLLQKSGAIVAEVTRMGPGEKAGLMRDDVILTFNGRLINESKQLPRVVGETEVDQEVPIIVWRDGKKVPLTIKVGEFEKAEEQGLINAGVHKPEGGSGKSGQPAILGMNGVELNAHIKERHRIKENIEGVLLVEVDQNSEAFEKGIRPGDIISSLGAGTDKLPLKNPKQFEEYVQKMTKMGRKNLLMSVHKNDRLIFVALSLKAQKE